MNTLQKVDGTDGGIRVTGLHPGIGRVVERGGRGSWSCHHRLEEPPYTPTLTLAESMNMANTAEGAIPTDKARSGRAREGKPPNKSLHRDDRQRRE
jgi:hypothetical protein